MTSVDLRRTSVSQALLNRKKAFETSTAKPVPLSVLADGVQSELKHLNQWICWAYRLDAKRKWSKIPVCPLTGLNASSTDPSTWASFATACQHHQSNPETTSGVGFVFSGADGFTGIDVDDCINEAGDYSTEAEEIISRFAGAYVERSPSGTGIKLWVRGDIRPHVEPGKTGRKVGNYEAYSAGKYFTATGHCISQHPATICDNQQAIDWFAKTYLTKAKLYAPNVLPTLPGCSSLTVEQVIEAARRGRNADKFNRLFDGSTEAYGSDHSAADLALCGILAFYCQRDPGLMEATFNQSGLAQRGKWQSRPDYRQHTINKAIEGTTEVYTPPSGKAFIGNASATELASKIAIDPPIVRASGTKRTIDFPVEVFPESLQYLIREASRVLGCKPDPIGTILLGYASLGIGNSRHVSLRPSWQEPPILYLAIVGWPGEAKSPIIKIVGKPAQCRQSQLREQHKQQLLYYEAAKEQFDAAKKNGTAGVAPKKPGFPHLYTTDVTTEQLAVMLDANPRGVGFITEEVAALMGGLNQYRGGKGRDRQFFLSAWSGAPSKVDRKSDGGIPLWVENPFAPILGGIQPDMLSSLKEQKGREDGWVHRFLFCFPPPRIIPMWGEPDIHTGATEAWQACFEKLTTLDMRADESGVMKAVNCRFESAAERMWKQWYDKIVVNMSDGDPHQNGPAHKMIAYAARLSLIIQCLRWACGETAEEEWIEPQSVIGGTSLADYFANQFQCVSDRLEDTPEDKQATELMEWIQKKAENGAISIRELIRSGPRRLRAKSKAVAALNELQDRGFGILDSKCFTLSEVSP